MYIYIYIYNIEPSYSISLNWLKLHFNLKLSKLPQKVQNFRLSTPHNFRLVTGLTTSVRSG